MKEKIKSLKKLFGQVSTRYETLVSELEESKDLTEEQVSQIREV